MWTIISTCPTLYSRIAGYTFSKCFSLPFWSGLASRSYTQLWARLWLPFPAWAGVDRSPGLALLFIKYSNQADPNPPHSLVNLKPLTWFCRWSKLLTGITTFALSVGTWSAKIQVLIVASPHFVLHHNHIYSDQVCRQISQQFLWGETGMKIPKKWPTMLGKLNVHSKYSLPLEKLKAEERPLSVMLCWSGEEKGSM